MQDFRKLDVWQIARRLTKCVYEATRSFPYEETFGLQSQMRRAAISICSNMAEGCGRRGDPEFGRFLSVALGSASELECETVLAADLAFIDEAEKERLVMRVTEVKRMLSGLMKSVRSNHRSPSVQRS